MTFMIDVPIDFKQPIFSVGFWCGLWSLSHCPQLKPSAFLSPYSLPSCHPSQPGSFPCNSRA